MTIDLEPFRIRPGEAVSLSERNPAETLGFTAAEHEAAAKAQLDVLVAQTDELQERLYAEGKQGLLVVLQAMDAGGKDSTIRKVFGGLNPQGVVVSSFKAPSKIELAHDYLWRIHQCAPGKGYIGVFNRSHYEDVLIVRVHGWASPESLERRYEHINAFEKLLSDEGTQVVKIMLHISKDYQLERFRRRLERPDKHWKFNPEDLKEREFWDDYMRAFEIALERCSTEVAPWYVIPAEARWFRDVAIAQLVHDTLAAMNPQYPKPGFDVAEYSAEGLR